MIAEINALKQVKQGGKKHNTYMYIYSNTKKKTTAHCKTYVATPAHSQALREKDAFIDNLQTAVTAASTKSFASEQEQVRETSPCSMLE